MCFFVEQKTLCDSAFTNFGIGWDRQPDAVLQLGDTLYMAHYYQVLIDQYSRYLFKFGSPINAEKHFRHSNVNFSDKFDVNFICYISQFTGQWKLDILTFS